MLLMILLAVGTGLGWVMVGILISRMNAGNVSVFAFFSTGAFLGLMGSIILMLTNSIAGGQPFIHTGTRPVLWGLIFWQGLASLINPTGMVCLVVAMRKGHQGLVWAISQVAMVIPFLFATVLCGDKVKLWGWLGVAFVIGAITLISRNKEEEKGTPEVKSRAWLWLALAAFALIGVSQILMSIPSRWKGWTDTPGLRQAVIFAGNLIVFSIFWFFKKRRLSRAAFLGGLSWAIIAIGSMLMLYKSLDMAGKIDLTGVVFPCVVGTCIAGFSIYSRMRLKEKYSALAWTGIVLCILGVVLIGLA